MRIYNPEKGLASFLHQHIGHPLVFETDESGVIDEFQEYEQPPTEQT